jgi:hypothetical protein
MRPRTVLGTPTILEWARIHLDTLPLNCVSVERILLRWYDMLLPRHTSTERTSISGFPALMSSPGWVCRNSSFIDYLGVRLRELRTKTQSRHWFARCLCVALTASIGPAPAAPEMAAIAGESKSRSFGMTGRLDTLLLYSLTVK